MKHLERLKTEALEAAGFRGHTMGPWLPHERRQAATSYCTECGKAVTVRETPWPNEIDIAGEAVALGCDPQAGLHVGSVVTLTQDACEYYTERGLDEGDCWAALVVISIRDRGPDTPRECTCQEAEGLRTFIYYANDLTPDQGGLFSYQAKGGPLE